MTSEAPRRRFYNIALAALQDAHTACFKHPDRDVLGMSHGPFSGVNQVLGLIDELEAKLERLRFRERHLQRELAKRRKRNDPRRTDRGDVPQGRSASCQGLAMGKRMSSPACLKPRWN